MEQLLEALRALKTSNTPTSRPSCQVPSGEGDVDLFVQQFQDVASENKWQERRALLQLRGGSQGNSSKSEAEVRLRRILTLHYLTGIGCPPSKLGGSC